MFLPGYAVIGKLLKGETVAKKFGVKVGDCIVAVNGSGFRRFAPDYKDSEVEQINKEDEKVDVAGGGRREGAGCGRDDIERRRDQQGQ